MNFVTQVWLGLVVSLTTTTLASSQLMQLEYERPQIRLESPVRPFTLWEHFEVAVEHNTKETFATRFHPLHTGQWYLQPELSTVEYREQAARTARGAISRTLTISAREVAMDLPIMVWLEGQRSFLADLVLNSLGNSEETSVAPLDPSYRALERSWWKRLSDNRNFCVGLRPFRTNPYAFISTSIWSGDSLLMLAHVRYHYRNFSDHQFELAVSLPLAHGFSLDVGTAYQLDRREDASRMVLKLSKQFNDGGIVHIGLEAQEHPKLLLGFSIPL